MASLTTPRPPAPRSSGVRRRGGRIVLVQLAFVLLTLALLAGRPPGSPLLAQPADSSGPHPEPADARIHTEDLDRFWRAWDAAARAEDAAGRDLAFFRHYYLPASPGLRDFIHSRIHSVFELTATLDAHRDYYTALRRHTPKAAAAAEPVREAFRKLEALYPPAVFPDVYLVVGRLTSGGTTGPESLLIGADRYGMYPDTPTHELDDWLRTVLRPMEDLPHIIVHELIHYQQPKPRDRALLTAALREGSADLLAEVLSGRHINQHVHEWALPREGEIWQRFRQHMDGNDFAGFLYGGERPEGWPQDVGYFVGYRIARAYLEKAEDRDQALVDILTADDAEAFLEASGYGERFEQESPPPPVELSADLRVHPLTDGVWRFVSVQDQGGDWGRIPANGLIVVAGDEAALIDTPWNAEQTRQLAGWIEETLGARLAVVVPTHSHEDCLGGLAAAHALGASSYGHEATARFAREAGDPAPQETFTDRLEVTLGAGDARRTLVLRHLGAGHTLDNIVVWIPDEEVLFGGCLVKSAATRHMGYVAEADVLAWPATLRRVAAEYGDAAWIVPGHGRPGRRDTLDNTLALIAEHQAEAHNAETTADLQPAPLTFPTSDGVELAGHLYGTGPHGVVLAHGGRFTKESWADQAPALVQAGFRVLAFDFRGRGESQAMATRPSGDEYARDVLAAVRELRDAGAETVAVVGGSFGGWASARAAVAQPEAMDRLVLLAAPVDEPEKLTVPTLFLLARDDTRGDGVRRLPEIQEDYEATPAAKELVILEGSAHAQFLFDTELAERVMTEIVRFLAGAGK